MSSPIADIRDIVQEHESDHAGNVMEEACKCMERIGYIMQVFYPEGVEYAFADDFLEDENNMEAYLDSERDGD
jgi:hypothetical protein